MADPISMPLVGWKERVFDPVRPRDTERMEGRRTEAQSFGTPYWTMRLRTVWLDKKAYGLMDAFMMEAGDDGETFLGYDVFRPRPILMDTGAPLSGTMAAGGVFNGDAVLQSILDTRTIVVSGLPAGFQLSPGDYVEIRKSSLVRSLHRIRQAATANSSGVVTLSIKYGLDTGVFTLPCTAHFEKPSCTMQIDPGSYDGPASWDNREISFTATEVFINGS
ncbi:hypothetical protein [Rhizobium sp. LCM 4573]|uniref:hypothetical protein n=1 Tax=Rhizobium sp. LCM 4573 TaxID=1848291 RepID=UPI0008D9070F|nr:hypothetical protein [Rhizobium sp. LCM 4573]OHV81606.1 hypothetical protein LCM4573_21210 [Rhizobium sp. LCM 4573]